MSKILFENSNIEFIDGDRGKNYPKQEDFSDKGHCMFLSAKNVTSCGFNFDNKVFISSEKDNQLKAGKLKRNDIVITTRGTIGNVAIYDDKVPYNDVRINSGMLILRADSSKLDTKFLYYYLSSKEFKEQVNSLISGSAVPQLPIRDIKKLTLPNITKKQQEKIANIISSFEDRIELNTQINQTLEQIAQALFKSWFVDFDPVRAKAQALSDGLSLEQAELAAMQTISGKTPEELTALSQTQPERYAELAETAKAFPCEMVEVDGVEVPKGWEVKPLPEIIDFLEGPGIRNWQYTEEEDGIKFINIRCIQNGDLTLTTANKITKEEAFGKYKHFQLEEDDIVVSTSGTLGRFAFVRKEHLPLSLNTSVIRFRPIKNKSTLGFIAGFVENQLQHELEIRASGSAQRNFGPTHLKQIALLVPNFKLLELHQKYASSLFEKRKQLLSEIDVLKDTRDLLLPKLLNGEFIKWKTQKEI